MIENYFGNYELTLTIYSNESLTFSKSLNSANGIALFNGLNIHSVGIYQIIITSNFLETYSISVEVFMNNFKVDFQPVIII